MCGVVLATAWIIAAPKSAQVGAQSSFLPKDHLSLESARDVDAVKQTAVLQLHKGRHNGQTVWFILTDASDLGLARDLNIMYSPKLANMAIGCEKCVQTVTLEPGP